MPGLTTGLNIGLSGLQASQGALNVVGHNIANVNTPGYARQRSVLTTGVSMSFGNVQFGMGVQLQSVMGIRNSMLDLQITQAVGRQSGANTRYEGLEAISSYFTEDGESGLNMQIQRFFQAFQEMAARPEDVSIRTNLLGRAQTMVTGMQSRYALLTEERRRADNSVVSLVAEVNTITSQIAELNARIASEGPGGPDNSARDLRTQLLDQLSEKVGIQVSTDDKGQVQVLLDSGSAVLVSGQSAFTVSTGADPGGGPYTHLFVNQGNAAPTDITSKVKEGKMGGFIDLRDNILPQFQTHLDQLAAGIAGQVNLTHRAGFGLNGNTGLDFFLGATANGANGLPTSVTAATGYVGMVNNLAVNAALVTTPASIAASSVAGAAGNNVQAKALANLYNGTAVVDTNNDGVGDTGPYSSVVGSLANSIGTQTQSYQVRSLNQENLQTALQNQRERISGVDLDEEAANLMTYQRGYQSAARFVSVINQLTDQLINQFGR